MIIPPENLPEGSRFLGYEDFTVQDIKFCAHNRRYRKERWLTPAGKEIRGVLPAELSGKHYGSTLVCFVLYQYYHAYVTQPLILEQLREIGIDISSGKVNEIITAKNDQFHTDKDAIIKIGLEISDCIHVDDTGARHQGKNGYCTHIRNDYFAWFESTGSKSRMNFLKLLRGKATDFVLNEDAIHYMSQQKMPHFQLNQLRSMTGKIFADDEEWSSFLNRVGIQTKRHVQIATEGGLLGSIIEHGINPDLVIMSDDAGQFAILKHALCWIHAERTINKLLGFGAKQRKALDATRSKIWEFYDDLKRYKRAPSQDAKTELNQRFDEIFISQTCYASLDLALERLYQNKAELLLVLDYPEIPLHNNLSERDIREYVKKRKISGSTRSDNGRRCRDTFISLKKPAGNWVFLSGNISMTEYADII